MKETKRKTLKRLKAQEKRLQRLKCEIADLIFDDCVRLGLPKDKTPKELLKILRRFHRIQHYECHFNGRREPIYHIELYEFYKEMIRKWTVGDVADSAKNMQYFARALKLTKQKATAKTIVDMAYSYVVCMNISWEFLTVLRRLRMRKGDLYLFHQVWCCIMTRSLEQHLRRLKLKRKRRKKKR